MIRYNSKQLLTLEHWCTNTTQPSGILVILEVYGLKKLVCSCVVLVSVMSSMLYITIMVTSSRQVAYTHSDPPETSWCKRYPAPDFCSAYCSVDSATNESCLVASCLLFGELIWYDDLFFADGIVRQHSTDHNETRIPVCSLRDALTHYLDIDTPPRQDDLQGLLIAAQIEEEDRKGLSALAYVCIKSKRNPPPPALLSGGGLVIWQARWRAWGVYGVKLLGLCMYTKQYSHNIWPPVILTHVLSLDPGNLWKASKSDFCLQLLPPHLKPIHV